MPENAELVPSVINDINEVCEGDSMRIVRVVGKGKERVASLELISQCYSR